MRTGGLLLLLSMVAAAQSAPPLAFTSVPTGLRPMGIGGFSVPNGRGYSAFIVIANSGDNSVSVFQLTKPPTLVQVLTGIPAPYGAIGCGANILVTSPSDNSVWVLRISSSGALSVAGSLRVGLQPYSISCGSVNGYEGTYLGIVSSAGDNTLAIFDPAAPKVLATIPGVAGSRAFGGIALTTTPGGTSLAWVSGTDADVVTVIDLSHSMILTRIPLRRPTRVSSCDLERGSGICIASASVGSITAIDTDTFASVPDIRYGVVPNLQDFLILSFSLPDHTLFVVNLAVSASPDSLWRFASNSNPASTGSIANIPGLATLAVASNVSGDLVTPNPVYVLATSTTTNSLIVISPGPGQSPPLVDPARVQFSVSNAASFAKPAVATGSLASLFGATKASQATRALSLPLPTSLGGATMRIGGALNYGGTAGWSYSPLGSIQCPLLFVGPDQLNFQVPPGISQSPYVPAQLALPDGSTQLMTLTIAGVSPGIFTLSQTGVGQGAVLNRDFSQNGSPQILAGARPAARGEVIQIFATGAGDTNPPLLPGEAAPAGGSPLVLTNLQPSVTIGARLARVLFSGMAPGFVGLWQINAEVPQDVTPGPVVPLIITAGSVSSNTVTIAVQ